MSGVQNTAAVLFFDGKTCRILVPQPGVEPAPWAAKVQSPNHWTTREVLGRVLLEENKMFENSSYFLMNCLLDVSPLSHHGF